MITSGSSPLSRGIPPRNEWDPRMARIIPALAGNTSSVPDTPPCPTDHPRSRGEYSVPRGRVLSLRGSSPLSRGILNKTINFTPRLRIIPALAGNTRTGRRDREGSEDHPRSRGEYRCWGCGVSHSWGSSPLSRGILPGDSSLEHQVGIIPALAGNTSGDIMGGAVREDHPRSRGEYPTGVVPCRCSNGSSPLSRGIPAR